MPLRSWIWTIGTICLMAGFWSTPAGAQTTTPTTPTTPKSPTPLESLKGPVDEVVAILKDPAFADPEGKTAQRVKIWQRIRPSFDFEEISRRTIGKKWATFSGEEKKKFTDAFAEFLGNTYIDKLQGGYQDEKIIFTNELVKASLALVRTKLVRKDMEIPIDYRMRHIQGQWLIYDILVENGVSLVKNYRVQFQSALQSQPPAKLIQQLEEKLIEQRKQLGGS